MVELEKKWAQETLLEVIDGVSIKIKDDEIKWDSSVYIGYLGDVIKTDMLSIPGENISGANLQNSIYVSESIILFAIVENVIKNHPKADDFICDLLSKDRTYLVSLRSNNDFSNKLRSDLSDGERAVVETLTQVWRERKKDHLCPDVGDIDANK